MSKNIDEIMRGYRHARVVTPKMVAAGMDVSDPDPANWKAYGAEQEVAATKTAPVPSETSSKTPKTSPAMTEGSH